MNSEIIILINSSFIILINKSLFMDTTNVIKFMSKTGNDGDEMRRNFASK